MFRLIVLSAAALVLASCGNEQSQPTKRERTLPEALTVPVRHEGGVFEETLAAVPKTFVLSYRCDSDGRRSLVFSPYPPMATTYVSIEAAGESVARGDVAEGAVAGPFLTNRFLAATITQRTGAATSHISTYVSFGRAGQCDVDNVSVSNQRQDHSSRQFSMNRTPARPTSLSEDGTIAMDLPEGWSAAEVSTSPESLTVGSFQLPDTVQQTCPPKAALSRMPADGALIWVSEHPPGEESDSAPANPPARAGEQSFSLGKPHGGHECGAAFTFEFTQNGRDLGAWVWVHPEGWSSPAEEVPGEPELGGYDTRTKREITTVLNSLQVQSARDAPVRTPFLALDCRNPPNTLDCDRVFVAVGTRVPVYHLSVRILRWSAETPDGWAFSGPVGSVAEWRPVPGGPGSTGWMGQVDDAGIAPDTSTIPVRIPPTGDRWVGNNPRIRADIEVTGGSSNGPRGTWTFRHVELIAGHG